MAAGSSPDGEDVAAKTNAGKESESTVEANDVNGVKSVDAEEKGEGKDSTLELERAKNGDSKVQVVSLLELVQFADKLDVLLMIVGTIGAVGTGSAQPLLTLLFGQLINAFGRSAGDTSAVVSEVSAVALRFVYVGMGTAVAAYMEVACWVIAGERQGARIRSLYLRQILRQDVSFFDTNTSTGKVVTRMSGDTLLIQEALGDKVGRFIQLFSTFLIGFVIAFTRSWKLTLVLMGVMPILVVLGVTVALGVSKMSNAAQLAYAEAGTLVEQVIGSIRTVASYTGERKAVQDYDNQLAVAERAGIWQGLFTGGGFGLLLGCMFASYALALWYGSKLVLRGSLTGGQVINVIFAVLTGAMALGQTSTSVSAIAAGRAAAFKIFETIKRSPPIDVYSDTGKVPDDITGDVEFRNVTFRYPTRQEVYIFTDFSLTIPAGKTVALVGESGSGKSTVVSLIERFYDPEAGAVLLDGQNIMTLQLKWLRKQIGLVSQEPVLFSASIKENIMYGKDNATMEEVETAAFLANAAKFINRVPQGYDTLVGERGIQLSGGQKQRIAIARAILKNPRILLLDEATSALDAESERVVQDALDRVMANRTTVVVAHRLTTVRNADMIAVVQQGVIVEKGTDDDLIRKPGGAYSQLVRLQELYGKGDNVVEQVDPDYVPDQEISSIVSRDSGNYASTKTTGLGARLSASGFGSKRSSFAGSKRSGLDSSVMPRLSFEGIFHRTSHDGSVPSTKSHASIGDVEVEWERNEQKKKFVRDTSVFRLIKLNKPEIPYAILGSAGAAATGLVFPTFGLLLSSVISSFFQPPHKLRQDISFWALMFLVLGVGVAISTPTSTFNFAVVGQRLIRRVRRLTFEKILSFEISWFDQEENSSGAISARLSADAAAVRSLAGDALALLVQNVATITAGLTIAFLSSWQLALVILAVCPLLGFQGYVNIKWLKGFTTDAKEQYEEASRVANDAVSSIRTVASFVAEDKICKLYDEKCRKPLNNGMRVGLVSGIALASSNLIMFSTFALCFWVGSKLVSNGTTTFKDVFRVFFAIALSSSGVTQTAGLAPDMTKCKIAVDSIFAILDRMSETNHSDRSGDKPSGGHGELEFKHVSFFYPTRPDVQIFQDISFNVLPGKTLALVGESGSGKSTVVSLIERFYDPQSGSIFVDGVDIQKLQLKWLRKQIGLVSQEPVLFDENVDWNIVYGQEGEISQAEIQRAAEAANAHKFISGLPQGYKTRVGERGTQLSGGQKQRVAIARAILKDPKILLLDEATSALDAESEHIVQEALDRTMVDRTTVVIAHRLSTVRNADVIAVVQDGAIVEHGKHDELIRKNGAYATLVKLHTT